MIDTRLAPYGAFVLRAALGVMFIAHAYLKLGVFTVAGFEGFLTSIGLPAALATTRTRHAPARHGVSRRSSPPPCLSYERAPASAQTPASMRSVGARRQPSAAPKPV